MAREVSLLSEINRPIVFLDMDGPLADFHASKDLEEGAGWLHNPPEMYEEGFFENLPVTPGALSSVRRLINSSDFDVHVLSQPVRFTHFSHSEKSTWIWKWFPELGERLHLSQNKALMAAKGRVLIDDSIKWKGPWESRGGVFLHFDINNDPVCEWEEVIDIVMRELLPKKRLLQ